MLSGERFHQSVIEAMLHPPTSNSGFALPFALSASAVVLLSSLSLQTLAWHRQTGSRLAVQRALQDDAEQAVAMDFLQRGSRGNACLLAWSSQRWSDPALCPGEQPSDLQSGLNGELAWTLQLWDPADQHLQIRWPDGVVVAIDVELQP